MRRRILSVLLLFAGAAPGADIVISGGGGPAPTTAVGTPAGGTVSAPSAGAGIVRLERAGVLYNFINPGSGIVPAASQVGDRRVFAVSTAGGIDWKPGRLIMLRGEVRNYTFTTPETDFVGSFPFTGERRNNLLFLGGIGLRF